MKLVKEISFAGKPGIRAEISMLNGGLKITGNDDLDPQVIIEMESVSNLREGEEITDYVEFSYDEEQNLLQLRQTDKKLPSLISGIKFTLTLPQQAEINSESTNGGVKVENIKGAQEHELTNGGCKFLSCQGRLEVRSTNGAIKVIDHKGEIDLEQKNGAIVIQDSDGNMRLLNNNGAVKLNHCQGALALQHKNGDIKILSAGFTGATIETVNSGIYYEFEEVTGGKFSFRNVHGRTNLIIPSALPYNIHARSNHGKINIGLDKSYEMQGDGQKEYSLTNGSGSVIIDIENSHGNINILDELHHSEKMDSQISHKIEILFKEKIIPTLENLTAENAPKVQEKLRKAGEKLSKLEINIPDIEIKIKKALNSVSDSLNHAWDDNAEDIDKFKDSAINTVNKTWENISGGWKDNREKAQEARTETVQDRSRLKILELLEKGKITPDEAEKLLKALGKD
ncbi:MAG: DUF4097 domain-containing protein [Candidatus Cloacimonetes bacterium]|nr:DUF4097 domain-containing protein [Candidatus Cloacimonadota bacterium]